MPRKMEEEIYQWFKIHLKSSGEATENAPLGASASASLVFSVRDETSSEAICPTATFSREIIRSEHLAYDCNLFRCMCERVSNDHSRQLQHSGKLVMSRAYTRETLIASSLADHDLCPLTRVHKLQSVARLRCTPNFKLSGVNISLRCALKWYVTRLSTNLPALTEAVYSDI